MTGGKITALIDELRPNNMSAETKLCWLEILEKKIAEHMSRYSGKTITVEHFDENSETLLGSEYLYMYAYYGVSMIDLANQDIAMYNNSSSFFNDMFQNWQKKWRREHLPQIAKGGDS